MTLGDLLADVPTISSAGDLRLNVPGIQYDSRLVQTGEVFVAIRGLQSDGHRFIPDAVSRGAAAVVQEQGERIAGVTTVQVPNSRRALAAISSTHLGHPARKLRIIGVTGTNGKTTVTHLARAILEASGTPAGLIGTINYRIGQETFQDVYHRTTPESLDLHRIFARMVQAGQRAVVMEVSSHALALERTWGIPFSIAAFTNMSRDHLDFHQTLEAYLDAKALLFEGLRTEDHAAAVINLDDAVGPDLVSRTRVPVFTYGFSDQAAVRCRSVASHAAGSDLAVDTPAGPLALRLKLKGRFNVYNALAAVAIGIAARADLDAIRVGIQQVTFVDGRFQSIDCGQDFLVLVDYAHTPDALEHALTAAKELTTARLISVFGCGGDRDHGKRPQMGAISARIANYTIVTSDNPRSEPPDAIIDQIVAGMPSSAHYEVQPDRRRAIRQAIARAGSGDTVLIAGKGHETYQIVGAHTARFDDRCEAEAALRARRAR